MECTRYQANKLNAVLCIILSPTSGCCAEGYSGKSLGAQWFLYLNASGDNSLSSEKIKISQAKWTRTERLALAWGCLVEFTGLFQDARRVFSN